MFNYTITTPLCFILICISIYFQSKYPEIFHDENDEDYSISFTGSSVFIILAIFLLVVLSPTINIAFTTYICVWTVYKALKNIHKFN